MLEALLSAAAAHKSAATVGAAASCLLTLCQAAPDLREQLGQLPGACRLWRGIGASCRSTLSLGDCSHVSAM